MDPAPRRFYTLSQGNSVLYIRAGIQHRCKAGMVEHLRHLARQFLCGLVRGIIPLRLHEVNMRVPEAGKNNTALAGNCPDSFGNAQICANIRDDAIPDHDRRVPQHLSLWIGVHRSVRNRYILRGTNDCRHKQQQNRNKRSYPWLFDHWNRLRIRIRRCHERHLDDR